MSKTAPFSFSVAFLTPPTFPAPAPRKRFFDPLPKKILGLLNPQRTTAAPPVPRAGAFRISRGPARRGIFAGAGVWYLLRPAACWPVGLADSWPLCRRMARAMLRLRACAAWYLCAGLRVWYLLRLPDWQRWRMAGRPADCRSWPPTCRPSDRHADTPPPSEPPDLTACRRSADLPPRPPAAPVCRSAAGQAGAAAEGIYRARYRPRIS